MALSLTSPFVVARQKFSNYAEYEELVADSEWSRKHPDVLKALEAQKGELADFVQWAQNDFPNSEFEDWRNKIVVDQDDETA